jgi:CheY-like chemotaxis protein
MSSHVARKIFKILYIQANLHEKSSANLLEQSTDSLYPKCIFTVVSNGFAGLEQLEFTKFDLLFIQKDLPDFHGFDMIQIIRRLRSSVPVILLLRAQENFFNTGLPSLTGIIGTLTLPFSPHDICLCISGIFQEAAIPIEYKIKKPRGRKPKSALPERAGNTSSVPSATVAAVSPLDYVPEDNGVLLAAVDSVPTITPSPPLNQYQQQRVEFSHTVTTDKYFFPEDFVNNTEWINLLYENFQQS